MYLSRLTFDERRALRLLADTYALHQFLYAAFPDREAGGPGRVLFRVESPTKMHPLPAVLVQSERAPVWDRLPNAERAVYEVAGPKEVALSLQSGQRLRFRLRANPTVKREFGANAKKPGHRRVGVYGEEQQRLWLMRKGEAGGFTPLDFRVVDQGNLVGNRLRGERPVEHLCVDYDGVLVVRDPATFAQTIESGIGSAKAFGYGLLSLARV